MFSFLKSVIAPASDEKAVAIVPSIVAAEAVDTVVTKPENIAPVLKEEITTKDEIHSKDEGDSSPSREFLRDTITSVRGADINRASREEVESTESALASDSFLEELTEDQPTMTTIATNTAPTNAKVQGGIVLTQHSVIMPTVMEDPVSPVKEEKEDTWKNIISPVKLHEEDKVPVGIIIEKGCMEEAHQVVNSVEDSHEGAIQNNASTKKDISAEESSSKDSSQDSMTKVSKISEIRVQDGTNDVIEAKNSEEKDLHPKDMVSESNTGVSIPISASGNEGKGEINEITNKNVPIATLNPSAALGLDVQNLKSTAQLLQSTNQFLESTTQVLEPTVKVPIITDDQIWQQKLDELELLETKAQNMLDIANSNGEITEDEQENTEKGSEEGSAERWSDYNDANNDDNDIQVDNINKDDDKNSGDDGNNNNDDEDDENENENENENDDNNICYGNIEDEVNEISGVYISDDENDDNDEDGDVITNIRDTNEVYNDYHDDKVESSVVKAEDGRTNTERSAAYEISHSNSAVVDENRGNSSHLNTHGDGDGFGDTQNSSTPIPAVKGVRDLLPIDAYKEEILYRIKRDRVTIIHGETGCGKSSRLPVILLEDAEEKGMDCRMMVRTYRIHRILSVYLAYLIQFLYWLRY